MKRRRYLATSVAIAGLTAGCASVRGETPLAAEEAVDRTSAALRFAEDGKDVLKVQLQKLFTDDERREYYPFRISTWQREGVRLSSLRLAFRSPPHSSGFSPAGIHLSEDGHAGAATLTRDGDDPSTTILDVPDVGDIGRGSVVVRLLLSDDRTRDPQELWVRVEAALSTDGIVGPRYSASGDLTVEFP